MTFDKLYTLQQFTAICNLCFLGVLLNFKPNNFKQILFNHCKTEVLKSLFYLAIKFKVSSLMWNSASSDIESMCLICTTKI